MASTTRRPTSVPPAPPTSRVRLAPARVEHAVLDGGWWPRSTDAVAELPGLALALQERYGPIRHVLLNSLAWDSRPRRLTVGTQVIRLGWFASIDPALVIAATEREDQLDILVVPPGTAEAEARAAMARAADPSDMTRAPGILSTTPDAAAVDRQPRAAPLTVVP